VADIQEEYYQQGCEATDRKVDIDLKLLSVLATLRSDLLTAETPGCQTGEDASQNRPYTTSQSPYTLGKPH
jgi:hypothetical protein